MLNSTMLLWNLSCVFKVLCSLTYKCEAILKCYVLGCKADYSPVALTPDYGGPIVCYADGVFDARFGRYLTVREGRVCLFFFFS